jgi:RHS repeat-associated protein
MKPTKMKITAVFMILLVITLPVVFAETLNLTYDENGNLITGDGQFRVYNSLNQLSKVYNGSDDTGVLLEEFVHDPIEERIVFKRIYNNDSSLKETVYYFDTDYVRVVNSSGTYDFMYVMHEGQKVAQEMNGVKHFIHADHLGSSTVITDQDQNVVENTTYSPFGEILTGGNEVRFGYEGKEHDSIVGDTDFHFRKYKSEWGLFTQPDSLLPNVYDPQQLNRYSFERNNPYKYVDKTGRYSEEVVDDGLNTMSFGTALIGVGLIVALVASGGTLGPAIIAAGTVTTITGTGQVAVGISIPEEQGERMGEDINDAFGTAGNNYQGLPIGAAEKGITELGDQAERRKARQNLKEGEETAGSRKIKKPLWKILGHNSFQSYLASSDYQKEGIRSTSIDIGEKTMSEALTRHWNNQRNEQED